MGNSCEFECSCGEKCTTPKYKVKYLNGHFYCDYHFKVFEKLSKQGTVNDKR